MATREIITVESHPMRTYFQFDFHNKLALNCAHLTAENGHQLGGESKSVAAIESFATQS